MGKKVSQGQHGGLGRKARDELLARKPRNWGNLRRSARDSSRVEAIRIQAKSNPPRNAKKESCGSDDPKKATPTRIVSWDSEGFRHNSLNPKQLSVAIPNLSCDLC